LSYEVPETVLLFTHDTSSSSSSSSFVLHILASKKKIDLLSALSTKPADLGADVPLRVVFYERTRKGDNSATVKEMLAQCGPVCGTLLSELAVERDAGPFLKEFRALLDEHDSLRTVEIADGVAVSLAVKDASELKHIETACAVTVKAFKKLLVQPMEDALEATDRTPTHLDVTRKAEQFFGDAEKLEKLKLPDGASAAFIDTCYAPIIMSGKSIDLKPSAASTNDPIEPSVIVCALGARYQMYCANLTRTYFIDPDEKRQAAYKAVQKVYEAAVPKMQPGTTLGALYEFVRHSLAAADESLAVGLMKNAGFGIGIEFRESLYTIKPDSKLVFEENMVFCLRIGIRVSADWQLLLSDTVHITKEGGRFMTDVPRKFGAVSYDLGGSSDDEGAAKQKSTVDKRRLADIAVAGGSERRSTRQRKSGGDTVVDQAALDDRQSHQNDLWTKAKALAFKRLTEGGDDDAALAYKSPGDFQAYQRNTDMPREASKTRVTVDRRAGAVLLPMCGFIWPLHVSTIKNVIKTDSYLRLQLITPISVIPKDPGSRIFVDERAAFVKEAAWRMPDEAHLNAMFRDIKELRKQFTTEESQKRAAASIQEQPELRVAQQRALRLTDVYLRPSLTRGKTSGTLEAHQNGFRFRSDKGAKVDVIYANIKHAFFQPSQNELITVIHVHLHHEILINKKKVRDIQFYTEVMEASQALDGGRHQAYDGIEEERRERQMRAKINKAFESFVESTASQTTEFEFDMPYRDLAFYGAPNKSNVQLFPTLNCLINITEQPFFVLTLSEVDFACLERVHFNNKTFDIIVVFKDYTRTPVAIRSVERDSVDQIREWLDSVNLPFVEGPLTFNWPSMLKIARTSPHEFFVEQGGWTGVINGDGGEGGEGEGDSDDESSATAGEFEPENGELEASDESFDSDEEFDSDEDEEDDDDDEDGSDEDDDDEAPSWTSSIGWRSARTRNERERQRKIRRRERESDRATMSNVVNRKQAAPAAASNNTSTVVDEKKKSNAENSTSSPVWSVLRVLLLLSIGAAMGYFVKSMDVNGANTIVKPVKKSNNVRVVTLSQVRKKFFFFFFFFFFSHFFLQACTTFR
jgi:nucleosome binding factor SPN SPT16 subunit